MYPAERQIPPAARPILFMPSFCVQKAYTVYSTACMYELSLARSNLVQPSPTPNPIPVPTQTSLDFRLQAVASLIATSSSSDHNRQCCWLYFSLNYSHLTLLLPLSACRFHHSSEDRCEPRKRVPALSRRHPLTTTSIATSHPHRRSHVREATFV